MERPYLHRSGLQLHAITLGSANERALMELVGKVLATRLGADLPPAHVGGGIDGLLDNPGQILIAIVVMPLACISPNVKSQRARPLRTLPRTV